jgi:HPt (histidine-containing phosphotransfer) domain-containing protein
VNGEAAAADIPTLLDDKILGDLYEDFASTGDLDELAELMRGFCERGAAQAELIAAAVASGDADAIRATAHKLKGSSRTLGACLLGDAAAAIEDAGDSGDVLAARRRLPVLEAEFVSSRAAIGEVVGALAGAEKPTLAALLGLAARRAA